MSSDRIIRQENPNEKNPMEQPFFESREKFQDLTINSQELEKLFDEWSLTGKGDLYVNEQLYDKLKGYLEYQKKLSSLMKEIANQSIERYVVPEELCAENDGDYYNIIVNSKPICQANLYSYDGYAESPKSIIDLTSFKYICAYIGSKTASYISIESENLYIDLRLWLMEMKDSTMSFSGRTLNITIKK